MAAIALYFMFYNFARVHQTLRVTPAMEAGIAHHVWTVEELGSLLTVEEPKKRGPYKKKYKVLGKLRAAQKPPFSVAPLLAALRTWRDDEVGTL